MMTETLGIALLHKSEMDNGVYRAAGDMCLFPPRTAKAFTNTAGAEEALGIFSSYLADKPDDLEVRWLLNLASMTLGRYPGGVPKQHLIPPSRIRLVGSHRTVHRRRGRRRAQGRSQWPVASSWTISAATACWTS